MITTTRPRRMNPHQTNCPVASILASHRPGQTARSSTLRPPWARPSTTARYSTPRWTLLGRTCATIFPLLLHFIRRDGWTAQQSNPLVTNNTLSRMQVTGDPPFRRFMRQSHINSSITLYHLCPDRPPRIPILEQVRNDLGNRSHCQLNGLPPLANPAVVPQTQPLPPTHTMMWVHSPRLTLQTQSHPVILFRPLISLLLPSRLPILEKCLRTLCAFRAMAHHFLSPSPTITPHQRKDGELNGGVPIPSLTGRQGRKLDPTNCLWRQAAASRWSRLLLPERLLVAANAIKSPRPPYVLSPTFFKLLLTDLYHRPRKRTPIERQLNERNRGNGLIASSVRC